jgi:3-oxoisoapionate kinase
VTKELIAFYGDDFTGSVDALLQFTRRGLRGQLFVGLPEDEELALAAGRCDVLGVAGIARSLPGSELAAELIPVLKAFSRLGARLIQYKACSTADSSPTIGSLGRAIELGRQLVASLPVPILFAQPDFGRYTVFGHHFAAEGGTVYRLDRQPTMSTHPSTPIHESDLALHLAQQTDLAISHLPFTEYAAASDIAQKMLRSGSAAVVLDAFTEEQLHLLGDAILSFPSPVFAIGSGGLSQALAEAIVQPDSAGSVRPARLAPPGPTLAVSGSRSPQTRRQVAAAEAVGWHVMPLPVGDQASVSEVAAATTALLDDRHSVVLTAQDVNPSGVPDPLSAIAENAARIIDSAVSAGVARRIIVCGGDTSSRVIGLLGISSLSIAANPWGNVALLSVEAPGTPLDGVELLLKGGQVGDVDLMEKVRLLGA